MRRTTTSNNNDGMRDGDATRVWLARPFNPISVLSGENVKEGRALYLRLFKFCRDQQTDTQTSACVLDAEIVRECF
jgi:hypothetical protein